MEKILVTGGCGYIGSHTLLEFLEQTDCEFLLIDDLSTGFRENLAFLQAKFPHRIEFFCLDLADHHEVEKIFSSQKIEGVLHFAAALSVEESTKNPLFYYKNNTLNTTFLLELCSKYQVSFFIFSSTAAVYGQPDFDVISEDFPLQPINPYGASKMMSERILQDLSNTSDLKFGILRYFNVAGANSIGEMGLGQRSKNATHLIKVAVECATKKRTKMGVFGDDYPTKDGTCIRDYIHINDLASAHLSAYQFLKHTGQSEIFNVGYSRGYSVKEIIESVKRVTKQDFLVEEMPRRAGDPAKLIANNQKILRLTNWRPKFDDIEMIIKSAYEWEKML
ncbi:UDP-glucose 4-epimerase GalE [Helicobacter mustelae]|uniref:UDP-glucose 4-epimerase n=1 Tax=Helicobacter mustelae (strain ATCC 43772 / CCUG 25715 / CIP 103759 / LMG 18044 / NCTC 12198 / R85-136P) TaxID=679897 RepID=D3UFK4_HELM1|nr:UDP-glucose 4-epimerase GalE [Helicobacter mustelae]CBG39275.1 UDP-glucose 4-epimerase [Helicobacter mustelae 12198]SQH70785.1 UDP-glucose 4-epimerase [Helicobacter mustelae]STP14153.1 UDP-glucose 4-epimerase [Helicobacter mustelae]